ncbi:hypothetical protein EDB87DRAFT_273221 [Lactarius vividus]|nr:hypothetical protein EDB87DRAFT_273221 [Lactarius vividus]
MSELTRRGSKRKGASQSHLRQGTLFDNFLVTKEPSPVLTFAGTSVEAKGNESEEQVTVEKTGTKDNEPRLSADVLEPSSVIPSDDRYDIGSLSSLSTQGIGDVDVEESQDNCTISQEHTLPSVSCDVDLAPSCSLAGLGIADSCTVSPGTSSPLPVLNPSLEGCSHIIDLTMEEEAENTPIIVEGSPILELPPALIAPPSHTPFQRSSLEKRKEVNNKSSPDAPFPNASMQHVRDSVSIVRAMPINLDRRRRMTTRASPEPSAPREPLKVESSTDNAATHVGSYRRVQGSERLANGDTVLGCHGDLHPAISSVFGLASELEDIKEPSQQHWNQKWRPRRAEHILGNEQNACYLREWMHALRLHFGTTPSSHGKSSKSKKRSRKRKRGDRRPEIVREVARKRQRARNLDGWIVDDDDDDEINEEHGSCEDFDGWSSPGSLDLSEPQPVSFGKKIRNTILLVGPPGSGKTAAVYACAEELGWNVFEVYPGLGKRGGTHLDELIGDVGKNHTLPQPLLFHRGRSEPPSPVRKRPTKIIDTSDKVSEAEVHPQSVVLIEEADVVFADEAGFWPSVVAFIRECRRPVIITCNDVSLIPLDILPLQTTLNFNAAPASLTLSLLNAICQAEGLPLEDASDLERQVSTADLRQCISQCQLGLTHFTCGKPVELADVADFSFQVKLEKAMVVESEADERKNLYALRQCFRGADAASFLDACVLLARTHDLEIADDHPDDEVGYKALKTRQRTTIPMLPEYYSRDAEMAATVLKTFKGILERTLFGISLDDAGETGQWARREEYRRRLWEGLKTDPALESMVDLPRLYLDYRPLIGVMVKVEDEEIARVTGRVKGRSSRLTERSCRWLNAKEELRGAVRTAGGLAGG